MSDSAGDLIRTVPQRFALYFDLDGTLFDIASEPQNVIVPPTLIRDLIGLHNKLEGALAVLTGRRMADADRFLAPLRLAGVGVHGGEVRLERGGEVSLRASGPSLEMRQEMARAVLRIAGARALVEDKSAGIAVHVRHVPEFEHEIAEALRAIVVHSDVPLRLEYGRRVIEVLPHAISKGRGLIDLSRQAPFEGRRPVVIGDDVSDEPAFAIARRSGGFALPVAGGRFAASDAAFHSARDVRAWISGLV